MTQSIIEKLEGLPRYEYQHHENNAFWDEPCLRLSDLRAIIEDAKAEKQEPVACGGCGNANPNKRCINCMHSFTTPQPDIVAELVEALEDVGGWINTLPAGTKSATAKGLMIDALLAKAKEMM